MKLWRLHLLPVEQKRDPQAVVQCCIRKNIASIGWPVCSTPSNAGDYGDLAEKKYGYNASSPAIRFAKEIEEGELIWTKDGYGNFYLGKVTGEWYYVKSKENTGMENQRPCCWKQIKNVPEKVKKAFHRGRALQQIRNKSIIACSKSLYAR